MSAPPLSSALVVVHGIGTQQRGDTLWQCTKGLLAVADGAALTDATGAPIEVAAIKTARLDHVRLRQGTIDISLHEAYWADLLPDEMVANGFTKFEFEETTWFGWLNWKAGLLPHEQYSRTLIMARTFELWFLQVIMSLGLEIVIASQKIRSMVLDQTAADVWNYVHSLGGELKDGSPLTGAGERILDRFEQACQRASARAGRCM